MFLTVGHAAILYQLGPLLWGLVVESGMTSSWFQDDRFDSWPRAFAIVLGSYAATFSLTANHAGFSVFTSAWIAGLGLWLCATHTLGFLL